MPYSWLTLADARTDIMARLGDLSGSFWVADEVDLLLKEAIQTFNVAALLHRDRGLLSTASGTAFYDLSALTNSSGSILARTLTVQQLVRQIIYHLAENAGVAQNGSVWIGTEMFTLTDVQEAVTRRANRFLEETGQIV